MALPPPLPGVRSTLFQTVRLALHALQAGPDDGEAVLFLHDLGPGALSFETEILALPDDLRGVALDLRGFGRSEALPVQAWRGLDDLVADVRATVDHLGLGRPHLVGHGLGGAVAWRYVLRYAPDVRSLVQIAPYSPAGLGGSVGEDGALLHDDGAPGGAGLLEAALLRDLARGDRTADGRPRALLRLLLGAPDRAVPDEDRLLEGLLAMVLDPDHVPGDTVPSTHWPGDAPGPRGLLNAVSRLHYDARDVAHAPGRPHLLWVDGGDDPIISDASAWDRAALGARGDLPGWPGDEACPAQPMRAQIRHLVERWRAGGHAEVLRVDGAGHAPHLTHPEAVRPRLHAFWRGERVSAG